MSDGFLGRWSKRKIEAKEGREVAPEPVQEAVKAVAQMQPSPQHSPASGRGSEGTSIHSLDVAPSPQRGEGGGEGEVPPPPTLADTHALTPESDFRRFAARGVAPEVKNAALKKLFTDPRYNIQDGLDVYIGDYSQPDPMPESMLRQLASAKFLGFFDDEEKEAGKEASAANPSVTPPRDDADNPPAQTVAQSLSVPPAVPEGQDTHADADLRLQQDDAAAGEVPGHGIGRKPDAA